MEQDYRTTSSEEYKAYLAALWRCSAHWVDKIQIQYARKAYEMYQNETVRKLVLKYGEQIAKLDEYCMDRFRYASKYEDASPNLHDDCLNIAGSLAQSIHFLFDIDMNV